MQYEQIPWLVVTCRCNCDMGKYGLFLGLIRRNWSLIGRDFGFGAITRTEEVGRHEGVIEVLDNNGVTYSLRPWFEGIAE